MSFYTNHNGRELPKELPPFTYSVKGRYIGGWIRRMNERARFWYASPANPDDRIELDGIDWESTGIPRDGAA